MRGCLTLILGAVLGVAVIIHWWPQPPVTPVAPAASDISITLSDAYLARAIQREFSAQTVVSLLNVRVESSPPTDLVVHGDLTAAGLSTPASIDARPVAQNGELQVEIISTQVAGVPLPPQIGTIVSSAIDLSLTRALGGRITVTGAAVTVQGLKIHADIQGDR